MEQLAEPRPFPGGGSAASHVGALALALVQKVVQLEKKRCDVDTEVLVIWNGRLSSVANLAAKFQLLSQEDGRAYARLLSVRAHVPEPDVTVAAEREIVLVPVQMIYAAAQGHSLISEISKECKTYLVPDLQVSCELLRAVARGAEAIASANLMLMESTSNRAELHAKLMEAVKGARDQYAKTKKVLEANTPRRSSASDLAK